MERPDPAAERIRAKKARKAEKAALRAIVRTEGIASGARFFLSGEPAPPPSEDCPQCLALQRRTAA